MTGDGTPDYGFGSYFDNFGANVNRGRAYLLSGADGALFAQIDGEAKEDFFTTGLADAGDVDGDGVRDLVASSQMADSRGKVYVYSGSDLSLIRSWTGDSPPSYLGWTVDGIGDVNQDGHADILAGTVRSGTPGTAYLFSGRDSTVLAKHVGEVVDDFFGQYVSGADDMNQDGWPDYVIGAPESDAAGKRAGRVYLYSGRTHRVMYIWDGPRLQTHLGDVLERAGDVNGDGFPDLLVGGSVYRNSKGILYLFAGNDLFLQAETRVSGADWYVDLHVRGGPPHAAARLFLRPPAGSFPIASMTGWRADLDAYGEWTESFLVPPSLSGMKVVVQALARSGHDWIDSAAVKVVLP